MNPQDKTPTAQVIQTRSLLDEILDQQAQVAARYMPTLTPKQFTEREKLIAEFRSLLVEGTDYGVIPGTEKPTLLQPGAQKVCAYFGYVPRYHIEECIEDWTGTTTRPEPLFFYRIRCELEKDSKRVGEGLGSCSSWESKYRYRTSKRVCPSCGVAALIEGKQWKPTDPKQWVCYEKKGGCKSKFALDDERITGQIVGRVPNEDFADIINTVLKIGKKRSYVDATLSATGLSQYFTADLEDTEHIDTAGAPKGTQAAADNVAQRKIAEQTEKQANGWPPEFAEDIRALASAKDGSALAHVMKSLQDELIATGFPEANEFYMQAAGELRARIKAKASSVEDMQRTAALIAKEIPRFRAMKAERDKAMETAEVPQ